MITLKKTAVGLLLTASLPWWLVGVGVALGGVGAALRAGISSEEAANLKAFQDLANRTYNEGEVGRLERIKDYNSLGHRASRTDFLGFSVADVMKAVRSTPIAHAAGFPWEKGDEAHYEEFAASPQRAYLQRLKELGWAMFGPEAGRAPNGELPKLRKILDDPSIASYATAIKKMYGTEIGKKWGDRGWHDTFSAVQKKLEFYSSLPGADQGVPIAGGFDTWLEEDSPELAKAKRALDLYAGLTTEVRENAENYGKVTSPVLTLRNYLLWIGVVAAWGGATSGKKWVIDLAESQFSKDLVRVGVVAGTDIEVTPRTAYKTLGA